MATTHTRPTWLSGAARSARYLGRPVARFLDVEAAGGILLIVATLVALVWANSPWAEGYQTLWGTDLRIEVGPFSLTEDLRHWVNDGLMTLFFFVVGLEIKRELVVGQLSERRDAALPAIAALGGMVVPAATYAALNAGGTGGPGWGIPMATDIAFALGVLALLGDRVPASLKVLLLSLAIVDDIGAIVVIAVFYTGEVAVDWLLAAAVGLVLVLVLRRARVWFTAVYAVVGAGVWLCTFESGVHATIAGVALGLLAPARPLLSDTDADQIARPLSDDQDVTAQEVREIGFQLRESVSVAERLEDLLHPWTSYVVIPLFALANAGIPLSGDDLGDALSSRITLGVVVGLVAGKLAGIVAFTGLAVRLGWGRLPDDVRPAHVVGMAALAGIGFTVSIFVSGLAFDDSALQDQAKVGVLAASVVAAGIGALLLLRANRDGAGAGAAG